MDNILLRIVLKSLIDSGFTIRQAENPNSSMLMERYYLQPANEPDTKHFIVSAFTLQELITDAFHFNVVISSLLTHENMLQDLNQFNGTISCADFIKVFLLGKYKEACINNVYGEYNLGMKDGQAN